MKKALSVLVLFWLLAHKQQQPQMQNLQKCLLR